MEVQDSVFSFRESSQNCMAAKSVFPLRLERAVSDLAFSRKLSSRAEPVLGTFAFYVKGRRASPPAEKMTQENGALSGNPHQTSPTKTPKSLTNGSSGSTSLPVTKGGQSREDPPKFQVLLVEDNLVNRRCLPSPFKPLALTMN